MKNLFLISCVLAVLFASGCHADQSKEFTLVKTTHDDLSPNRSFAVDENHSIQYSLFLPEDYVDYQVWPMIVFLHGAGERGTDLELLKKHGVPKIVARKSDFPFVVLSPLCPKGQWWDVDDLMQLIDMIVNTCDVDSSRVYLTGLSMGGFGTWEMACKYPEKFAAIAPISGGGEPIDAKANLKDMPIWAFHGARDIIISVNRSKEMVEAVKSVGGNPKFTIYPDASHDAWTATYDNPELYEWFLKHRNTR